MDRPAHEPPVTGEEIRRWAWQRSPAEREPLPQVGEHVLFRESHWDVPVPAVITAGADMPRPNDGHGTAGPGDSNVWDENGNLHPDPWPWVTLRLGVDGAGPERKSKESRVRGAPGWLRPGSRWDTQGTGAQP